MKKVTNKPDWKNNIQESTQDIFKNLDELIAVLQKNKKIINKNIKAFGAKGSGVYEVFEKLTLGLDTRITDIWNIIEED